MTDNHKVTCTIEKIATFIRSLDKCHQNVIYENNRDSESENLPENKTLHECIRLFTMWIAFDNSNKENCHLFFWQIQSYGHWILTQYNATKISTTPLSSLINQIKLQGKSKNNFRFYNGGAQLKLHDYTVSDDISEDTGG